MTRQTEVDGVQWIYSLVDGRRAVTLNVITWPAYTGGVAVLAKHEYDDQGGDCDLVEGKRCALWTSALHGRRFWKEHGNPKQHEQNESFWKALEQQLP